MRGPSKMSKQIVPQFLSIKAYPIGKSKGYDGWTVQDIVNEALRQPGNCGHIENPEPPEILFGDPWLTHGQCVADFEKSRTAYNKKLPIHTNVFVGGVASWVDSITPYKEWRDRTVEFVKKKWPNVSAIVAHHDEYRDHGKGNKIDLHFFVPAPITNGFMDIREIHPGIKAREELRAKGKKGKERNVAYKAAMHQLQKDYYTEVAGPVGMLMKSKDGLTLEEKKSRQRQAEALLNVQIKQQEEDQKLEAKRVEIIQQQTKLETEKKFLEKSFDEMSKTVIASLRLKIEKMTNQIKSLLFDNERLTNENKELRDELHAVKNGLPWPPVRQDPVQIKNENGKDEELRAAEIMRQQEIERQKEKQRIKETAKLQAKKEKEDREKYVENRLVAALNKALQKEKSL